MKALLTAKVGMFLVVSSVLAVWTLLAAQHVQAHSTNLPTPSCSGLPTAADFFTDAAALPDDDAATPKKGTDESGEGNKNFYYAKITVPPLTAGNLSVSSTDTPADAILCGRQEGTVTARTTYTAHNSAESAQTAATTAQTAATTAEMAAGDNDTRAGEIAARRALSSAATALQRAATALRTVATALRSAGHDTEAGTAEDVADRAYDPDSDIDARDNALVAAGTTVGARTGDPTDDNAQTERPVLGATASVLGDTASALDTAASTFHMGFAINTLISSGDDEYVVVVAVPEGANPPSLGTVGFEGVMSTVETDPVRDSFTRNNERITRTLRATNPGLLTVKTTGGEVRTIGTLMTGADEIAMDEGSGGNFQIISPMDDAADYALHVDGQTRGERGEFGLKVEFGVAPDTDLTIGTAPANTELQPRRANYFFFAVTTPSFLTVETEKPMGVQTETNTTGTLFSQKGVVATDTDSGTGNNFLLRAPISEGDYIVEVKGASASTKGAYVLATSSEMATDRGSAPNMLTATPANDQTLAAGAVVPYSIAVTAPGTLQVKTTGDSDTVGVLYGPDGQQIATDDNSGDGMNFLITESVGAGQYIVTVEGQSRTTMGMYTVVVNFVESVVVGTTNQVAELEQERDAALAERNTARTALDDLQDEVDNLRDQVAPVTVDATGNLGNPPNDGVRSGIGLISGWVCAANSVQIRISNAQGRVATLNAAYGTTRADTVGSCDHQENTTGFGMTFNFNLLDEGTYTIGAYADGLATQQIGQEATFEVVHLTDEEFPRGLKGECRADDFPEMGDKTILEWEQSIQNFVISDVQ